MSPLPPPTELLNRIGLATSGLGAATASSLSSWTVIPLIIKEITSQNKDAHLKAFQVDLSSFQSISKFKDSLKHWLLDSDMHSSIQLLINNTGILATSSRVTAEGYDK
ncbi:hypothetical protein Ddye_030107 [Dipteronia dyeriana]|uniref:Uncharacterized protein n=1 Tax=Dipteronia dyeriana TaxID=168575 RepID=A0AAD9TFP4_9ROSI|nr:hypothetical protein Ddye_030107 [Dipteronia dyeriana]